MWFALGRHTATVMHRWQQLHPQMPLHLLRTDDSLAGLAHVRVYAVILRGPVPATGIHSTVLFHEKRNAALSLHNDLAQWGEITLSELAGQTLTMNMISGTTSLRLWHREHQPRGITEVGNTDDCLAEGPASPPPQPPTSTPTPEWPTGLSPTHRPCQSASPGPTHPATPRSRISPPSSARPPVSQDTNSPEQARHAVEPGNDQPR
ncbi:LysR substrate-binding domain-containing protein [Streptomyces anulatus]|uniref:LysR substrate-binding domain-containing protein n=1 Tax=Streptomyces anulatus TaxID=1892 RepID=UPI002E0FAA6D|nr:LysR substrate-binding domain-containing protein [Streptomyces anulatus]